MSQAGELYLIVTQREDLDALDQKVAHISAQLPLACVLFAIEDSDEPTQQLIKQHIAKLRQFGCPCMSLNKPVKGVDGTHFTQPPSAKPKDPDMLVGAGPVSDKHQALEWAEKGLDYVWFGPLNDMQANGEEIELAIWWAQFVEVPCVLSLMAETAPTLKGLDTALHTKADYIALSVPQLLVNTSTLDTLAAAWPTQSATRKEVL